MTIDPDLTTRIAGRVRDLRERRGWSLDELAGRSTVSRSTISLIERAETNATAVVLDKLATALDVTIGALLGGAAPSTPVARRAEQPLWTDPGSGYRRRTLSPAAAVDGVQLVEIEFPADVTVSFEPRARASRLHQQVWVLAGAIEISTDEGTTVLARGDCYAFDVDRPVVFRNRGAGAARYLLVQHLEDAPRRREREDR